MVSEPGSSEPELKLPQVHLHSSQLKPKPRRHVHPSSDSSRRRSVKSSVLSSGVKMVSKKMAPRRHETRRGLEYEKQDGGHELKEKEVGDDPDSQIQQKSWPVSQNAKGINLVPCYKRFYKPS
ncbi:hypothetical protein F2Q69_00044689 [Brassica cretica]|uniref:Uncharacterized protein n=1 Tax=Brassica cretica TaxID=69181 RepID=A0A8S9N766_BRACR|nr:hypothetical protein F2Q69_00044689 [Brassica cretica]